jgi:hypothetical protein
VHASLQVEQGRLRLAPGELEGGGRREAEQTGATAPAQQEQFDIPKQLKQRVVMVTPVPFEDNLIFSFSCKIIRAVPGHGGCRMH